MSYFSFIFEIMTWLIYFQNDQQNLPQIKGIKSPSLFNLYAEYIMWFTGLMNQNLESRLPVEISATADIPHIYRWYHPNGGGQRGTKEPLDKGERREWKKLA